MSTSHKDLLSGWLRQGQRYEQDAVLFDLARRDGARIVVRLIPQGSGPCLAQTAVGDVSCGETVGVQPAEAAAVARAFAEQLASGAARIEGRPPAEVAAHVFALRASGFTVVSSLLEQPLVAELAMTADRAMAETRRQLALGALIPDGVFDRNFQIGARSIHLWGDSCLRVLENETIRQLSEVLVGPHKLLDVVLFVSYPTPGAEDAAEGWHRDVEPVQDAPHRPGYLWFMLPLDDFTSDNGATWVVPGSHRLARTEVVMPSGTHPFPSRVQMLVKAGDALVLDPATLHSRGHNATSQPRRMLNVMICHESTSVAWQWDYAGRRIKSQASPRVRELLGGTVPDEVRARFASAAPANHLQRGHATRTAAWPALPDDWQE